MVTRAVGRLKTGMPLDRFTNTFVEAQAVEQPGSSDCELVVVGVLPSSEEDVEGTAERSSEAALRAPFRRFTGTKFSSGTGFSFLVNGIFESTFPFFLPARSFFPYSVELLAAYFKAPCPVPLLAGIGGAALLVTFLRLMARFAGPVQRLLFSFKASWFSMPSPTQPLPRAEDGELPSLVKLSPFFRRFSFPFAAYNNVERVRCNISEQKRRRFSLVATLFEEDWRGTRSGSVVWVNKNFYLTRFTRVCLLATDGRGTSRPISVPPRS